MEATAAEGRQMPACDTCGREAAVVLDGRGWCASCLHARGSCCAEAEMEDDPAPAKRDAAGGGS